MAWVPWRENAPSLMVEGAALLAGLLAAARAVLGALG
jgi:hypothetical protein